MAEMGSIFGMPQEFRDMLMRNQMREAQGISDAVPRQPPAFQWAPPAHTVLPELPSAYRPPEYWNYGKPVRMA